MERCRWKPKQTRLIVLEGLNGRSASCPPSLRSAQPWQDQPTRRRRSSRPPPHRCLGKRQVDEGALFYEFSFQKIYQSTISCERSTASSTSPRFWAPTLGPGGTIIRGKLGAPKAVSVREATRFVGQPPLPAAYSRDLNPRWAPPPSEPSRQSGSPLARALKRLHPRSGAIRDIQRELQETLKNLGVAL